MPDKHPNNRPQLNIRLEKFPQLLDDIKSAASDRNTTASQFVIDTILSALCKPTTTAPIGKPSLDGILAEIDELIDAKLDKRLGELEQRLLAQFRRDDRQTAPEEDRRVTQETRPETRLDYQEIRDRILRSLKVKVATSSPQYRAVSRALDRFISELEAEPNPPQKNE